MAQETTWCGVQKLLKEDQDFAFELLIHISCTMDPERWSNFHPNPIKEPEQKTQSESSHKNEPTHEIPYEPKWTQLKKDLSEAKTTLKRIEETILTESNQTQNNPSTKKPKSREPRTLNSQMPRTTRPKPICNPDREVVLTGVPYNPKENLQQIIEKLASDKGVEVHKGDIIRSFRALNKDMKSTNATPPKIIVEWATNKLKNEFKRHNPRLPIGGGREPRIYINENLTQEQRQLFYKARQTKKKFPKEISHVWTRDGHCFVRRTKDEQKIRVTKDEDLLLLALRLKESNPNQRNKSKSSIKEPRVVTAVSRASPRA